MDLEDQPSCETFVDDFPRETIGLPHLHCSSTLVYPRVKSFQHTQFLAAPFSPFFDRQFFTAATPTARTLLVRDF